ncbi:MAG: UvrD-helicase domain-containing protein [Kiritimatiellaceae bacterium]|nr:UvrD-helicase domain-containing protein [Kiritimatiellaceae bacterium]
MNMIFNASAGTGKTWQVTELYTALVLGKDHEHLPAGRQAIDPRRILLMTFTDNAAAELRCRVAEKMLAAEKSGDDEQADRARRVLRSLPAAGISTIHAFCAGLLREHALELGLSPAFQTLEDEERDALLDEVLKAEIFQNLEGDADFREFCSGVSILGSLDNQYSLINTIRSLLEKSASRGLNLNNAEAMLPPPERTVGEKDFRKLYEQLRSIEADRGLPAKATTALQCLEEICRPGDLTRRIPLIESLTKFTGKGMKEISDELAELKERFLTGYFYEQNISQFRAFARCLSACSCGFTEAKRSRDAVDFGDQLLLARDLLRRGQLKNLFDWIIVDEVQDTSRVQCDVIEALWGKEAHLVICGDRKQSIYAWRSADPDVMPMLGKKMATHGGFKPVPLKKSRRSKDRVIDAVNKLFGSLYDSYDALEPCEEIGAVTDGEGPCVEFLMQDGDESTTDDEMTAVASRIRLLVDGGAEWRPRFGYNGKTFSKGEPFNYGDILILLKRSTHQSVLEEALRDAGIPYTSGGKGRALFEQQEVRDLLLFLQVLCEPTNDLALIGFLRSPFASVPDDEIVKLGWDGETFSHEILRKQFFATAPVVGQGCRSLQSLPRNNEASLSSFESLYSESLCSSCGQDDTRSRIREARPTSFSDTTSAAAERLLRYRAQTGGKLAAQLVREIVRETAFDAQLAGLPGGEQRLANFKKALDWIRAAERGGQVLLPDVVRRFEKYIQTPPRSGAAEALLPDPEQNSVTLMTVHSAKGLTKRVCFVPDISFGENTEPGFAMFSPEGQLEMKISGLAGDEVKSPGWDAAREADKEVRDVELTNVFYVAMTRARDLVVLSGAGTKDPKGWRKLAEGFLSGASANILRRLAFLDIPVIAAPPSGVRNQESGAVCVSLRIPVGIERKTVTSLCERNSSIANRQSSIINPAVYGSLGHAVLEDLTKNNWAGNIPELVALFSAEFGEVEMDLLIPQLEAAREILRTETAGATALFAEHPFVLKRGDVILDGTIDLLAKFSNQFKIFDYKFTDDSPESALEIYAPQLAAYKEAVQKLYSGATVSAALVLIGESVKLAPFST